MKTKVKTIDINALEWFDKVNGNSYFAAAVIVNYQMKGEQRFILPYQYGYGDQYRSEAARELDAKKIIELPKYASLWEYCDKNKIILRADKQTNCKKRELLNLSL